MKVARVFLGMLTLAVLYSSVQNADAQFRMRMAGSATDLLGIEQVQQELELDDSALEKVNGIIEDFRATLQSQMEDLRSEGLSPEDTREEMQAIMRELSQNVESELAAILSEGQLGRLKQLQLQQLGLTAVMRPEVAAEIGLSDEESAGIRAKVEELQAKANAKSQTAREERDFETMRSIMEESRKEIESTLRDLLTEDQIAKLEEMQGEKFEFPQPERQGGRRGGRNDF